MLREMPRLLRKGLLSYNGTPVLALALSLSALGRATADDWPQWLGPQRDGVWRGTGILDKFPEGGPQVRWRTPIAAGYSGPAVANGKVYITDRVLADGAQNHKEPIPQRPRKGIPGSERVLCLNEADGKLLWKHEYDCTYTCSYPLGPRTTPTVHDGKVYTLGTEGNLFCLNAETGKVLWSSDFKKDYGAKTPLWGFSSHPLVDGQKLICIVGGEGSVAVAFDKDTGKEIWKALKASQQGYSPPMIYEVGGRRQLIIWDADAVHGLDPETGNVYWSQPAKTYQGMSIATPRKFGDDLFVTAYPDTSLMLHVGSDQAAVKVAWNAKERKDKKKGLFTVFSTPAIEEGHIYGVTNGGILCCIKADTGEELWRSLKPHGPKPLPSAECFLIKNGDRYFLFNEKGDLIIARLSPQGYEEVSRAHLLDPTSAGFGRDVLWTHPAFANKSAYTRNDKEIICVSLAAK
jgi:outer membrane protein assembly factor BamB